MDITLGLYGGKSIFGGKETPLTAKITSCEMYEKCSYYKKGECLGIPAPFVSYCKHAKVRNVQGYTSRAKKYYDFQKKYKDSPIYSKLKWANDKVGVIGDEVVLPYPHLNIDENLNFNREAYFGDKIHYVSKDKFDADFVARLSNYVPQALMGGSIDSYQKNIVPKIQLHISEELPEVYQKFKEKYPDKCRVANHVGRKAILQSLEKGTEVELGDIKWKWSGIFLEYMSGNIKYFGNFNDNNRKVKPYVVTIEPTEDIQIVITSNEQVNDKTVFID